MRKRFFIIMELIFDMDSERRDIFIGMTLILLQMIIYGLIVYFFELPLYFLGILNGLAFNITALLIRLK